MGADDWSPIDRPQTGELLRLLGDDGYRAVQVVGPPGSGKSSLLNMVEAALNERAWAVFSVSCRGVREPRELGLAILAAVRTSRFGALLPDGATVRSSAGGPDLQETTAILQEVGSRMPAPVLLLDGLDEAVHPDRIASGIEQLLLGLNEWKIVVSTRPGMVADLPLLRRWMTQFSMGRFTPNEASALVRKHAPALPDAVVDHIVDISGGNPHILATLTQAVRSRSITQPADVLPSLTDVFRDLLGDVLGAATDPDELGTLVDELALIGGRCDVETLSIRLGSGSAMVRDLVLASGRKILVYDTNEDTVSLFHVAFRDFVLAERIRFSPVRLADLQFGSEAAEKDDLLNETFVESHSVRTILDQRQSVIVGDRGSGKSALFRKLSDNDTPLTQICPIANTGDLLHRIVAPDSWADAQALRAAWLVAFASVVAGKIPPTAPKELRRKAADLRAALGFPTERPHIVQRVVRVASRPFLGTKLSFAVGPVTLQAQLPSEDSGRHGKGMLDIDLFLAEADAVFGANALRVVMMVDRIDETFKYNREKQETVVQALLQAEGHVSLFDSIGLIVFLRTDLFELYDIQEKTKLVSRTLTLDWTEEKWLQVLVRRLLVNDQFRWLADRVRVGEGTPAIRTVLRSLFPVEIENQPVDRWLVESLRNGNGDISPRLAVLLLHLARKQADESEVSALPIFSAATLATAMTKLSDLSFSEVVNDFKVASSFVLNCRAGKLETFTLASVKNLFDEAEGKTSEQVRLLERLGFLERIVRTTATGVESLFRIPKLYTRCWDYA